MSEFASHDPEDGDRHMGWFRRKIGAAPIADPAPRAPLDPPGNAVTQCWIDPARARIWPGNARIYSFLSEASCRDLMDSIIAEDGQKMPAIVRRIDDDPDHDYEVVVGTRRHFAISWLRDHGHLDFRFLVQVEDFDDEAAFRIADLENRARADISDIERARNYADALEIHYGGHLTRMASRLNISKGWLSKMIKVATLPDEVIAAFLDPRALRLKHAYVLARAIEPEAAKQRALIAAYQVARAQSARLADGHAVYAASEVCGTLIRAATAVTDPVPFSRKGPGGEPLLNIVTTNRRSATLRLFAGSGANRVQILAAIEEALNAIEAAGTSLC